MNPLKDSISFSKSKTHMMTKHLMPYLLDADVFIRAMNLHYGLDFCPAFWDWFIKNNLNGKVFSVEKVECEVLAVKDELSEWAGSRGSGFFLRPDSSTFPSYPVKPMAC